MKGYWFAIEWIAYEDEPLDTNLESVKGYISTNLVADLFDKSNLVVAENIISLRTGNVSIRYIKAINKRKDNRR